MLCSVEHMRQVGQDAAQSGMRPKNCGQQNAVSASHVHEASPFAEIVCGSDDRSNQCRHTVIASSKIRAVSGCCLQVFEGLPSQTPWLSPARPVSMLYRISAKGPKKNSLPLKMRMERTEPGTPVHRK